MKKFPEMKTNQNKTKYINPLNISVLIILKLVNWFENYSGRTGIRGLSFNWFNKQELALLLK